MHSYNHSLVTSGKGVVLEAVRVTFGASGAVTYVDTAKSNLFASVVKTATGRYTFTMNKPYAPKLVALVPAGALSCVNAAGAVLFARYVEGSYSPTAGTFEVDVSGPAATPAAIDPTSGTAMDLVLVFRRYSN